MLRASSSIEKGWTRRPADPPKVKSVKARSRERSVWSPERLRAFLHSAREDRLYGAWMLVATTGLRRGEIMGLRWKDIDLDKRELTIEEPRVVINYRSSRAG